MLTSEMDLALTSLNSAFSLSPSNLLDTEPIEHHGHHRRSPDLSIGTLSMPSSSPANVSLEVGLTGIDSYCMYNPPNIDYDVTSLGRSSESTVVSRVASHDLPDTKEGIDELCPVCGDKVSGYHYGLLTCESCKGFFKRTVQNKKVYTCIAEKMCHIDKSQRKRCPYCRFQKCLDVGMKLEAVRADRMRGGRNKFGPMYKRDRARKLQAIRERSRPSSVAGTSSGASGMGSSSSANISYEVPYTPNGFGLKHEIQIPQISSVTSSPDSSSSPANFHYPGSTSQNPATVNVSLSIANSPAPGPSQSYNLSPTRQSGPPRSAVSLSPKNFQFETMIQSEPSGAGSGMSMNHNNNNNINNNNLPMGVPCSAGGAKTPPLIRDLVQSLDDKEWQNSLYGLLQSQTYNQCEVDLFELLCKVLDQNLFTQVDWARNSFYFKELKVDDQMKLLQNSWSSMLILDHLHHRLHNHLPDESILPNGQKFDLLALSTFGCPGLGEPIRDLINKLSAIRFDVSDYACLKFLVLLNPDVKGLTSRYVVSEAHEQVQQAMFDYSLNCYQHVPEKFGKMMALLPELQAISSRGEEYLYYKHLNGCAHTQTLLMEMLHTKRKQ